MRQLRFGRCVRKLTGGAADDGRSVRGGGAAVMAMAEEDEKAPAREIGTLAQLIAYAIGISFLWPCLGGFVTMRFRHVMAGSASLLTTDLHAAYMSVLFAVAAIVCLACRKRIGAALRSSRAVRIATGGALVGLAGHLCIATLSTASASVALSTLAVAGGLALSAAFIVMHVLGWGEALSRLRPMAAIVLLAASSCLSYVVQTLFDLIPGNAMLVYLIVCPVGSGVPLAWALGRMPVSRVAVEESSLSLSAALSGIPWRFVIPTFILFCFEQLLSSLLFQRYPAWSHDYLTVTLLTCSVVWAVAAVWLKTSMRPDGSSKGRRSVEGILLALFSGLLILYMATLLVTVTFLGAQAQIPERLMVAAGSSLRVFLYIVLAWAVCEGTTTVVVGMMTFVVLSLVFQVSRLSALLFSGLSDQTIVFLTSPELVVPVVAAMLFAIATGIVVVESRRTRRMLDLENPERLSPADPKTSLADGQADASLAGSRTGATAFGAQAPDAHPVTPALSYGEIASQAGLTAREAEVFDLVCHGYSARAIGERLGISESTVVTHVTHIHRKFGVSSKQELIAEVERRRLSASA